MDVKKFKSFTDKVNENVNRTFTIEDLKKAYDAEKVKKTYFRGDPEGLLRNIPFEQWYKENYDI